MAIKPGETITYGDLVQHFFNWIQNDANLLNVAETQEAYVSQVPIEWRTDFEKRFDTERTSSKDSGYNDPVVKVGAVMTANSSTVLPRVSINDVRKDFNTFMHNRGMDAKTDTLISTRGIINFWNNVATFCAYNIVIVSSNERPVPSRMYKKNQSWPTQVNVDDSELIVAEDVTKMLANLEEVVNRTARMHQVVYDIAAFSSSSSSSSSSCSSSCSSSSSIYIAYMNI